MMNVKKALALLGLRVEDRTTGLKGVVTSICFDLYGCVQGLVHPGTDQDGKLREQSWLDISRLKVLDQVPVMAPPAFELESAAEKSHGPAEKPSHIKP